MAQRRKPSVPDLSGLLVERPIMRGFTSPGRFHKDWLREQQRLTEIERQRALEVKAGRDKARKARKTFGRMPNPKAPYKAFGGARAE